MTSHYSGNICKCCEQHYAYRSGVLPLARSKSLKFVERPDQGGVDIGWTSGGVSVE